MARALRLIGGACVLTGMSPAAAEVFASLGDRLGDLRCLANLREGLRHCLLARAARRG